MSFSSRFWLSSLIRMLIVGLAAMSSPSVMCLPSNVTSMLGFILSVVTKKGRYKTLLNLNFSICSSFGLMTIARVLCPIMLSVECENCVVVVFCGLIGGIAGGISW